LGKFVPHIQPLRLLATAFVSFTLACSQSVGAEIKVDPSVQNGLGAVLEGRIDAGDFARVVQFIGVGHHFAHLYLASPGGDVVEAMRIGSLVRLLNISTTIPSKLLTHESWLATVKFHGLKEDRADYRCGSACFFIFVAGVYRAHEGSEPAILGIHKPSVSTNASVKIDQQHLEAIGKGAELAIGDYLKAMGVPSSYLTEMYSIPQPRVRWIRNDEFEKDFAGFIPQLKGAVADYCGSTELKAKQLACETKFQESLAFAAYDKALQAIVRYKE
jgi:hypothetical protein